MASAFCTKVVSLGKSQRSFGGATVVDTRLVVIARHVEQVCANGVETIVACHARIQVERSEQCAIQSTGAPCHSPILITTAITSSMRASSLVNGEGFGP